MTSNITATEKGRRLVLTVGDEAEDISVEIIVPPVNTAVGTELYALWAGILFGKTETPIDDAQNLARNALGAENLEIIDQLRPREAADVINAAFFWNVQGGGIDLVNEMLRDGLPKARMTLASENGSGTELSLLMTLLAGVKEREMSALDAFNATTTQLPTVESSSAEDNPTLEPTPDD